MKVIFFISFCFFFLLENHLICRKYALAYGITSLRAGKQIFINQRALYLIYLSDIFSLLLASYAKLNVLKFE